MSSQEHAPLAIFFQVEQWMPLMSGWSFKRWTIRVRSFFGAARLKKGEMALSNQGLIFIALTYWMSTEITSTNATPGPHVLCSTSGSSLQEPQTRPIFD